MTAMNDLQSGDRGLLRLATAGSVDDGKSTLIGRLLMDSKLIYEDHLAALERDSAGHPGREHPGLLLRRAGLRRLFAGRQAGMRSAAERIAP